ncbi:SMI1/KNR4 family protein [Massilia sp. P8910]|uniref:SMI1/KNR4 family protein n=1 Tax=Massilia antarctica TaxID=2765360 RepID=UPI001E3B497F|nr:SMI1/KNR4 family protein [Massilia antarctica]MCE3602881.1 SMI1/KNR4 family protein [Massilia antarctica]
MLSTYLARIDERITTDKPHLAEGLLPGADENDLAILRQTIFEPAEVPEDLATFFRWHNGQSGYESLSPLDNRMLMSIDDVIDTCSFLSSPDEDIQQPWQDNWLPILANGGGDYVVYVTSGVMKGQLIAYWHTDDDRRLASIGGR